MKVVANGREMTVTKPETDCAPVAAPELDAYEALVVAYADVAGGEMTAAVPEAAVSEAASMCTVLRPEATGRRDYQKRPENDGLVT